MSFAFPFPVSRRVYRVFYIFAPLPLSIVVLPFVCWRHSFALGVVYGVLYGIHDRDLVVGKAIGD